MVDWQVLISISDIVLNACIVMLCHFFNSKSFNLLDFKVASLKFICSLLKHSFESTKKPELFVLGHNTFDSEVDLWTFSAEGVPGKTLCGSDGLHYYTVAGSVTVEFHSDDSVEEKGFEIEYMAVYRDTVDSCKIYNCNMWRATI